MFQKKSLSRETNVITLLDPFSLFISEDSSKTMTMKKFIDNLIRILKVSDAIDDIIQESEENKTILLSDTIERILVNTYKISADFFNNPVEKDKIKKISSMFFDLIVIYSGNIEKDIGKSQLTVNELFNYFKNIQDSRSDENFLLRELITLLNSTTKYDNYKLIYNDTEYNVSVLKSTLAALAPSLFPREPSSAYFKLSSIALNGILKESDITFTLNDNISNMLINNLQTVYSNGYIFYFSKIIASILKVYDLIKESGNENAMTELMKTITDDNFTLSQKYQKSVKNTYILLDIKSTIKGFIEDIYFLPVTTPQLVNDTNLYTYDEIRDLIKKIENDTNLSIEEIIIRDLLNSKASNNVSEIIRLNNNIKNQLNGAITKYPDVLNMLVNELNTAIGTTLLVQVFFFHESLGNFNIEAAKTLISNVYDEPKEENKIDFVYLKNLIDPIITYYNSENPTILNIGINMLSDETIGYVERSLSRYIYSTEGNLEKQRIFILSFIEYVVKDIYKMENNFLNNEPKQCLVVNLSKNWEKTLEELAINMKNNIQSEIITIQNAFDMFKNLNQNSNENYTFRKLIDFLQTTSDFDDLIFSYDPLTLPLKQAKVILNDSKEALFPVKYPSESSTDHYTFFILLLNGIISLQDVKYEINDKIKNVQLTNFEESYYNGTILFFLKSIIIFLKAKDKFVKNNDEAKQEKMQEIIDTKTFALSKKRREVAELMYGDEIITIDTFISVYYGLEYFVLTETIRNLFPEKTGTFENFMNKIDELEENSEDKFEITFINAIIESSVSESLDKMISLNNDIYKTIMQYKDVYPTLFQWCIKTTNSALLASQVSQLMGTGETLGKYYVNGIKKNISTFKDCDDSTESEPEPEPAPETEENDCEKITTSLINNSSAFTIEISTKLVQYSFCRIRKIIKSNMLDGVEKYLMNALQE